MTENSNEDANNEFYEEAREILNEPVRTRAQKEFNKELEYSITKARTAKLDKEPILGNYALYTTNFTEPLSYQGSAFLKLPKFP